MEILDYDFMRRAFLAAALVGLVAPVVGVFLVQRRMALLGDGMGHIALTGIGLSFLLGTAPLPTAMLLAAIGAILVEVIRERSRTAGDLALALLFYGGIAGGVLFVSLSGAQATSALNSYLFGSLSTVSSGDVAALVVLAIGLLGLMTVYGRELFVVSLDPDLAATQGIKVSRLSMLLAAMAAVAVVVGMRVVGLLLVSAIMIVPIAAAQQVTRSFAATLRLGVAIGVLCALSGLTVSYYIDVPPGPAIVIFALAVFAILAVCAVPLRRRIRA